jgi:hypothetical protein
VSLNLSYLRTEDFKPPGTMGISRQFNSLSAERNAMFSQLNSMHALSHSIYYGNEGSSSSAGDVECYVIVIKLLKLHGLSPRANYTDRATAACRRSDCQLVRIEGATWSA